MGCSFSSGAAPRAAAIFLHAVVFLLRLAQAIDVDLGEYDFIVVGSGAGGAPLAARLAMAGKSTLLIEAGDDQGASLNYTVPAFSARASEDEAMAWNFFVRHYADDARQARDPKTSYETSDQAIYTGLDPPPNARMLGTLYPRSASLGGCTSHHALVSIYPHKRDFDGIADLTGDESWRPEAMRKIFERMERNRYLFRGTPGHGFDGWLSIETAPLELALQDFQLLGLILGGSFALGNLTEVLTNIATIVTGDANDNSAMRDAQEGYYQTPISADKGRRVGPRDRVVDVRDAKLPNGEKKWPLYVRTNCHVTKVVFDESGEQPRATGVEFLDGAHLYRASPRSRNAAKGVPGFARARHEVIVSGGAYNSPQILKLSGIGPADELRKHDIKVISNLPGVGTNLQDHYEVSVSGRLYADLSLLHGCTFGSTEDDKCLRRWKHTPPKIANKGPYVSNGLPVSMVYTSSVSYDYDIFAFGGPQNFVGYYPGYSAHVTSELNRFTWAILKSHPRNRAGTVTLRSAHPLDVPDIVYNYFDTGSGDAAADLKALCEGIRLARDALRRSVVPIQEILPGPGVQSDQEMDQYIADTAWGHHASSTCAIGADDDPMAVLDSSFRVRGVRGLRVVDASVYPRIPGTFTAVSTFLVGEKAADVILSQTKS